ncbi:MAG: ATP-binding protein [Pseudomonadota bacterium]
MLDTLLKQNVAVLAASIFAALIVSIGVIGIFIIAPQVQRIADTTASIVSMVASSAETLDRQQWENIVSSASSEGDFAVTILSYGPETTAERPRPIALYFRESLLVHNVRLAEADVTIDQNNRVWMRLNTPGEPAWLTIETGLAARPVTGLALAALVGLLAALIGGIALQQRVARPLRALESHMHQFSAPGLGDKLDEKGPRELAAVSSALNSLSDRLRQTEADRALMLAGVSHDLRTPLTKLRLSMAMLDCTDKELLESAVAQVNRIETMLGQFLEYARGFEAEEYRTISMATLISEAGENAAMSGQFTVQMDEDFQIHAKPNALMRAIGNLMKNAADYGEPPIMVVAAKKENVITIDVIDRGPGMTADRAETLVRPFARGNEARSGNGTGLGLAIANEAAQAHGGSLQFMQTDGGFCARIFVPAQVAIDGAA